MGTSNDDAQIQKSWLIFLKPDPYWLWWSNFIYSELCFVLNILSATNIYLAFAIDKSQGTAFGPDPLWLISVQIKFKLNSSNALSLIF